MNKLIIINKNGDVSEKNVKKFNFENIYKYNNLKNNNDFDKRVSWEVCLNEENFIIQVWCKNKGKHNQINKYEFPPPIDKDIYYGSCVLIKLDKNNSIINLSIKEWNNIYEKLFGGFDDIDSDSIISDDDLENVPINMKTKTGYLKDGFVVDDNIKNISDEDIGSSISELELEDEEYYYSSE